MIRIPLQIILALVISTSVFGNTTDVDAEKPILEISDKYSEVRLGLTDSKVYMIFSNTIKDLANKSFESQSLIDTNSFKDSEGNFILPEYPILKSNRIEFSFDEIESISFNNGKLSFKYSDQPQISFEDILSYNGVEVLRNFYVEDLENFALLFRKYV